MRTALDLVAHRYKGRAVRDPSVWPEAFMWAAAAICGRAHQAPCLAIAVALRWPDDADMRTSRPWNGFLSCVNECAGAIIARYDDDDTVLDPAPLLHMVVEV